MNLHVSKVLTAWTRCVIYSDSKITFEKLGLNARLLLGRIVPTGAKKVTGRGALSFPFSLLIVSLATENGVSVHRWRQNGMCFARSQGEEMKIVGVIVDVTFPLWFAIAVTGAITFNA